VFAAVEASRAALARWLDWVTPAYDLREAVRAQRRAVEYWNEGESFQWRIWQRRAPSPLAAPLGPPQQLLGSIDLHTLDWPHRRAELGYWLDDRAVGQGYLTEAGHAIGELGFAVLGFAELVIRCHPDNARSLATARRLGFAEPSIEHDGVIRLVRRR
jgi:RimJ/RimL family protein N-acetyltransferase